MEERRDTKIFFVPERVEEARRNASDGRRITNDITRPPCGGLVERRISR